MIRTTGLAVSAALLLAACGPDGGKTITGMIDSCATLQAIDAPEVLGVAFESPQSLRDYEAGDDMGKLSSCGLTSIAPEGDAGSLTNMREQMQNTWFVTLMAWTWPNVEGAKAYMDSMRQSEMEGIKPEAVKGLGDDAIWNGTIHARTGNVTISMDVRGPTDESGEKSEKALETQLATRALENLE